LKYGVDFTVKPIPKRSHGQKATVKPFHAKEEVMDTIKQFKNSPEIREYWKIHKRQQRAKAKTEAQEKLRDSGKGGQKNSWK
jgi:hypothetical protein